MFRSLRRIAAVAFCAGLCLGAVRGAEPVKTARDLRRLTPEEARAHPSVSLEGVITYSEPAWYLTFFADATGGAYLGTDLNSRFSPGDRVRVTGVASEGKTSAIVTGLNQAAPQIQVLGHGPLPAAKEAALEQLSGALDADWIEVRGEVRSVARVNDRASLQLDLQGRIFEALICGFPDGRPLPDYLTGAAISARGVLGTFGNDAGGVIRTVLYIPALRECEPEPAYLERQFSGPAERYSDLFGPPGLGGSRRAHLQGQVSFVKRERGFFMRVREAGELTGSLWVQTSQPVSLQLGQLVEVTGRVELNNRRPLLHDALVREIGIAPLPRAEPADSRMIAAGGLHGVLVTIGGAVIEQQSGLGEDFLILLAGSTAMCARLELSDESPARLPRYEKGSRLQVTGICVMESQQTSEFGPQPFPYQVWMRTPQDIALIAAPPWWTMRRVLAALGLLGAIAACSFAWIVALRRRVIAQTQTIGSHVERQTLQEERVRIAREFHDTFEQHLVGLALMLQAAEAELGDPERARELLGEATEMARHTREEARHAIWELRTGAILSMGLASLIEEELGPSAHAAQIELSVETRGAPRPLPAVVQNHLLRIAQEGFTNILKHAGATRVEIAMSFEENKVQLTVKDDGGGFDAAKCRRSATCSFGLAGMQERALRMGGVFEIESAPGKGSCLTVRIPLSV